MVADYSYLNVGQVSTTFLEAPMAALLAGTAVAAAGLLNVSFSRFCPDSCLSGHDPKADIPGHANTQL